MYKIDRRGGGVQKSYTRNIPDRPKKVVMYQIDRGRGGGPKVVY